jgi:hypothetical protein
MRFLLIVCFLSICSWEVAAQKAADAIPPETPVGTGVSISEDPQQDGSSSATAPVGDAPATQNTGEAKDAAKTNNQHQTDGTSKDRCASWNQSRTATLPTDRGATGYAKRYGAQFADGTIENFMTKAILPSLLHQDPRYFQLVPIHQESDVFRQEN